MGTRKPKKFPVSTLKALAACAGHGLTYHAHLEGETTFWAVDGQFYHVVKQRTTRGGHWSAHYCQTYRSLLADRLRGMRPLSRKYTQTELVMVCPSWLCDQGSEFLEITNPADALAQIWIEGRPA